MVHPFQHTEIITRIKLDYSTKTVVDGALFTQELLPAETALYALLLSESDLGTLPQKVNERKVLQLGGDETIGKGWCWAKVEGN